MVPRLLVLSFTQTAVLGIVPLQCFKGAHQMKMKILPTFAIAAVASIQPSVSAPAQTFDAGSWGGKVRSGPTMQSRQVGSLRNGDPVQLLENTGVMMNGYPWWRIGYGNGRRGFQWGGILCGYDAPIRGTFRVCDRDNRRNASAPSNRLQYSCSQEARLRSKSGDRSTRISFRAIGENDETQFKIYWLDYQGRRQFYKHIFAGDTHNQQTYMTHPWVVTAPIPGGGEDCVAIYMPTKGGRTIKLR
jgi:hypothetical protein